MKELILIILSFVCLNLVNAQSNYIKYFELIELAEYEKGNNEINSAIQLYQQAFALEEGRGPDYLQLANCHLKIKEYDQAKEYIFQSIKLGIPKRYVLRLKSDEIENSDLKKMWKEVDDNYQKLRNEFYATIDIETLIELQIIKNSDQEIREHLMSKKVFFEDSTLVEYATGIDALNLRKLLKIIEQQNQWPGFKSYGDAESGAFYILLHFTEKSLKDTTEFNTIYEILYDAAKEGVKKGELTPFQFAYWIDYHLKEREGLQLYGVPSYQNWEKYPFKDKEQIDERRREIGLPSLEILYKRANKELPTWYQSVLENENN